MKSEYAIAYARFGPLGGLRKVKADIMFSNTILSGQPVTQLPEIDKQVLKAACLLSSQRCDGLTELRRGKGLEAIMNDHDHEAEKARELTADLQKAALSLIKHLRTNNFRIRIDGIVPAVYITLGEGRSSYSADSVIFHGPQAVTPGLAPTATHETAHVAMQAGAQRTALAACFSRLRKALAA